jgi:hypothetical protein
MFQFLKSSCRIHYIKIEIRVSIFPRFWLKAPALYTIRREYGMPAICERCEHVQPATRPTDDDEFEALSVWSVIWSWTNEPETLCGACLDERNDVARQTTGHYLNHDAPELVTEYVMPANVEYDDPTPIIAPAAASPVETCENPE